LPPSSPFFLSALKTSLSPSRPPFNSLTPLDTTSFSLEQLCRPVFSFFFSQLRLSLPQGISFPQPTEPLLPARPNRPDPCFPLISYPPFPPFLDYEPFPLLTWLFPPPPVPNFPSGTFPAVHFLSVLTKRHLTLCTSRPILTTLFTLLLGQR